MWVPTCIKHLNIETDNHADWLMIFGEFPHQLRNFKDELCLNQTLCSSYWCLNLYVNRVPQPFHQILFQICRHTLQIFC